MSQALTGSVNVRLFLALTDALDNSTPTDTLDYKHHWPIASGTGADQADRVFHDTRTIAANGSTDIDVVGTLLDAFGDTFSPARIKLICIVASSGNSHNINIGGTTATAFLAGFNAAADMWGIPPGDIFLATNRGATAWACAAASTDKLKVANASTGNTATYFIGLVAASA